MDTTSFNFTLTKTAKFDSFLDIYAKKKDKVSNVDQVAVLLYCLYLHVASCWSKKVIKAYLGLVVVLHRDTSVVMGLFVLSHIFKRMHDMVELENDAPSRTAKGPLWMIQIWLATYFCNLFH